MPAIIESAGRALSMQDVAVISKTLAEDMQDLVFSSDGVTVSDYLAICGSEHKIEFAHERLHVYPAPSELHEMLKTWIRWYVGSVLPSLDSNAKCLRGPFTVRLGQERYCRPDVILMLGKHSGRRHRTYWDICDLVVEIVNKGDSAEDTDVKRADYAAAGIPEYWLVDPEVTTLTQFVLGDGQSVYDTAIVHHPGSQLICRVLDGLTIDVERMFADAEADLQADSC